MSGKKIRKKGSLKKQSLDNKSSEKKLNKWDENLKNCSTLLGRFSGGHSFNRVRKGTLPWAISFFFKWEEHKYFSPYAYCFIFKSDLLNSNFVEKKSYFILLFLKSYFFDEQSKFLDVQFYWNKKVKHRFIDERKLKLV